MNGMLVATKDFDFVDEYRGPQKAVAGRLHVREGSELALAHPECFAPADERSTKLRDRDQEAAYFGREAVRVTGVPTTAPRRPRRLRTPERAAVSAPAPDVDQRIERDRRSMRQQRQLDKARVCEKFGPIVVRISDHLYRSDVCRHVQAAMTIREAETGFQLFAVPESRPELHISRIGRPAPDAIRTPTSFARDESWDVAQLAVARQQCPGSCEVGFLHTHADGDARLSDEDVAHLVSARELFSLPRYTFVIATPGHRGWERPELFAWTAREELLQDTFATGRVLVERARVVVS